jgi:hypothetical protein
MQVTKNLLRHAEAKLKNAQRALEAHPTNRWLTASVEFLQDEVETLRRNLLKEDARLLASSERSVPIYATTKASSKQV